MNTQQTKDEQLWKKAEQRVSFRIHLYSYLLINAALWGWWFLVTENFGHLWPLYPMFGWGIGLFFHYIGAYADDFDSVEKEYEKLKEKQQFDSSKK